MEIHREGLKYAMLTNDFEFSNLPFLWAEVHVTCHGEPHGTENLLAKRMERRLRKLHKEIKDIPDRWAAHNVAYELYRRMCNMEGITCSPGFFCSLHYTPGALSKNYKRLLALIRPSSIDRLKQVKDLQQEFFEKFLETQKILITIHDGRHSFKKCNFLDKAFQKVKKRGYKGHAVTFDVSSYLEPGFSFDSPTIFRPDGPTLRWDHRLNEICYRGVIEITYAHKANLTSIYKTLIREMDKVLEEFK